MGLFSKKEKKDTYTGEAYCVKCKSKRQLKEAEVAVTPNQFRMAKGTCEVCGTKMSRILGKVQES